MLISQGVLTGLLNKLWTCFSALLQELLNSRVAPAPDSNLDSAPVLPPNHPREPFIPTPARYSGALGTCSQFLHQCSLVFDQQPLTYSTDRSKIAFIMILLSDKASAWALALSDSNSPPCNTLPLFTAEMKKIFDHSLQGKEASSRLLSLQQGSSSVSQYSVDFRILAAECGWDERALQGVFVKGLREEPKDELAARDETSRLDELISLAIRLDNRLHERRRERAARLSPPFPSPRPWSARPPAPSPPPPGPPVSSGSPSQPHPSPAHWNPCSSVGRGSPQLNANDDDTLGSRFRQWPTGPLLQTGSSYRGF